MSWSLAVVYINIICSSVAALYCFKASRKTYVNMRPMYAAITALCATYCFSYIWLAFNVEDAALWSQVLRPVGAISWILAWAWPARHLSKMPKDTADRIEKILHGQQYE